MTTIDRKAKFDRSYHYESQSFLEREKLMAVSIKAIHVENFRSIGVLDAQISPLAVFVGKNDCGKSNILRALNLFFNDRTNHGVRLDFDEDYNFFAPGRNRKAKEILVRLEIEIPESYRRTNGDLIIWEKRWRKEGMVGGEANYKGIRLRRNRRGREIREAVVIPDKSNLHALLRKIEFEYVPAVKDARYFDDLRGRIYNIISEVASRTFRTSSTAFEQSIGVHLEDLTQSIDASLGSATRLALPRDLSHIFEKLDFLSGEQSVSLENRGDGIKARHIPLILKFMALKKVSLQGQGGMPSSFIWGYEEPENNLEFASAIVLADELVEHVNHGVAQILLTTHSPAFYDLAKKNSAILLQHVSRLTDTEGTKAHEDGSGLDEALGTLAMISSRVSDVVEQVRLQAIAEAEAQNLLEQNRPKIFVEGESDAIILRRAMELFFTEHVGAVDLQTVTRAGHTFVISMLEAWRMQHKFAPDGPKAAGIVDSDAIEYLKGFNNKKNNLSAKCFTYAIPNHVSGAFEQGFQLPIDLEALYPLSVWEWASEKNYLEQRNLREVYPPALIQQILSGTAENNTNLEEDWRIYVQSKVKSDSKTFTATYLAGKSDDECRIELACFEPTLNQVLVYLGLID